jgi:uncharacterized membrane protein YccC
MTAAMPEWLTEIVRTTRTPVPWMTMIRSALAICVPLSVAIITGHRSIGALPAMGGMMGVTVDTGGPYLARIQRVATAAVFGGGAGLAVGQLIHGRGWIAVVALMTVAAVSAALSTLGATGSVTALQLLVYSSLGLGPIGALHPWWKVAAEFVLGVLWALVLLVPGWLFAPRGTERRSVARVYHALAGGLRAIGTPEVTGARRDVTAALNHAYDVLLTARAVAGGRSRPLMRLMAILNASHLVAEAATALRREGEPPPGVVADIVDRLADAVAGDAPVPLIPPPWSDSQGSVALRDSLVTLAALLSGDGRPLPAPDGARATLRERLTASIAEFRVGAVSETFAIRLMASIGVAAMLSEVLAVERSYWVVLTTAIVLKPDYGSVFARALQRGLGTIAGAVLGAVLLVVVPYGPWLLIPFGVLAALLPYGRARSFGLTAVFLTPLVVLQTDLLAPLGWRLAQARLIDTVLGCLVALVVGYAPWPASWRAHLPSRFADTLRAVGEYTEEALIPGSPSSGAMAGGPPRRSRLRRRSARAVSDLLAEFQVTISEPRSVSCQACALWPAVVELEEIVEVVTATGVGIRRGAPLPSPTAVRQLTSALGTVADAVEGGVPPPRIGELPSDEALKPVTGAVRTVLGVLAPRMEGDDNG